MKSITVISQAITATIFSTSKQPTAGNYGYSCGGTATFFTATSDSFTVPKIAK
jgi:hypothetical protein